MSYIISSSAVAIPRDWKTAGEFKRLQRILNDLRAPVAVDGKIGPETARATLSIIKRYSDLAPAWDMTPIDQVQWLANNVVEVSAALANFLDKRLSDYSSSNTSKWLLVSPLVYRWHSNKALKTN